MLTGIVFQTISIICFVIATFIKCLCKKTCDCNCSCISVIAMGAGVFLFIIGFVFIISNYYCKKEKINTINKLMEIISDKSNRNFDKITEEHSETTKVKTVTEKNYFLIESIKYIANAIAGI
ncbi:MAG: hypothetical protein MJ188_00750 [Treponema sp.]|nr:hypothetical protein [Treponema sp.]